MAEFNKITKSINLNNNEELVSFEFVLIETPPPNQPAHNRQIITQEKGGQRYHRKIENQNNITQLSIPKNVTAQATSPMQGHNQPLNSKSSCYMVYEEEEVQEHQEEEIISILGKIITETRIHKNYMPSVLENIWLNVNFKEVWH